MLMKRDSKKEFWAKFPKKLTEKEVSMLPNDWYLFQNSYSGYLRKAKREEPPALNYLFVNLVLALLERDRTIVDEAYFLTKDNVRDDVALVFAGNALCDLGFEKEGIDYLRLAVQINPSNVNVCFLATCVNTEEKIKISKEVLINDPDNSDALRHLAFGYSNLGKYDDAEVEINKALKISPKDKLLRRTSAFIYLDQGKYSLALKEFKKCKSLFYCTDEIRLCIANCLYRMGEIRKARKLVKKMRVDPELNLDFRENIDHIKGLIAEILGDEGGSICE